MLSFLVRIFELFTKPYETTVEKCLMHRVVNLCVGFENPRKVYTLLHRLLQGHVFLSLYSSHSRRFVESRKLFFLYLTHVLSSPSLANQCLYMALNSPVEFGISWMKVPLGS